MKSFAIVLDHLLRSQKKLTLVDFRMEVTKALITRNFTYLHSKNIFSNTSKQKWRWKQSSSVSIESFDHTASAGKRNIFVTYVQKIIRRYLKVIIGGLCSSELHFPITNDFEAKKLSFDSGGKKKTVALLPTIANNCMIAIMNTSKIFKSWERVDFERILSCWVLVSGVSLLTSEGIRL